MNLHKKIITNSIIKSLPAVLLTLALTNCGSSGKTEKIQKTTSFQQNHGPFDSSGNYVEGWADKAPKYNYSRLKSTPKKSYTAYKPKKSTTKKSYTASKPKKSTPKKSYSASKPKKSTTKKSYTASKPKKSYTAYKPKKSTTPKKVAAKKFKPKTKAPIYHTVKKGDTLFALSRKYNAQISSIQKANRLTGTSIPIGKRLIIPRK